MGVRFRVEPTRGSIRELTPLSTNRFSVDTPIDMSRGKVVVTRNMNLGAQALLDAQCNELEVVQWRSDKVSHTSRKEQLQSAYTCSPANDHGSSRM